MKCARKKNTETNPKKSEAKKEAKTKNLTKKKHFNTPKEQTKLDDFIIWTARPRERQRRAFIKQVFSRHVVPALQTGIDTAKIKRLIRSGGPPAAGGSKAGGRG